MTMNLRTFSRNTSTGRFVYVTNADGSLTFRRPSKRGRPAYRPVDASPGPHDKVAEMIVEPDNALHVLFTKAAAKTTAKKGTR